MKIIIVTDEGREYETNDVVASTIWTRMDIAASLSTRLEREPTEEEVDEALKSLDSERLEDSAVQDGWQFIEQAVTDSLADGEEG